jgi:hypothetical protein
VTRRPASTPSPASARPIPAIGAGVTESVTWAPNATGGDGNHARFGAGVTESVTWAPNADAGVAR